MIPRSIFAVAYLVAACSAIFVSTRAWSSDVSARIESFGLYRIERVADVVDATHAGGRRAIGGKAVLLEATDRVPLKLGISFGVELVLDAPHPVQSAKVRRITRFPPPGLRDPKTGRNFTSHEATIPLPVRVRLPFTFVFDEAWELVPGDWKFEFWIDDEKAAEKTFFVR
jgi:hypothetical protein